MDADVRILTISLFMSYGKPVNAVPAKVKIRGSLSDSSSDTWVSVKPNWGIHGIVQVHFPATSDQRERQEITPSL